LLYLSVVRLALAGYRLLGQASKSLHRMPHEMPILAPITSWGVIRAMGIVMYISGGLRHPYTRVYEVIREHVRTEQGDSGLNPNKLKPRYQLELACIGPRQHLSNTHPQPRFIRARLMEGCPRTKEHFHTPSSSFLLSLFGHLFNLIYNIFCHKHRYRAIFFRFRPPLDQPRVPSLSALPSTRRRFRLFPPPL